MAQIVCDEHGGTPVAHVCPHVFEDVINKRPIDRTVQLDAEYLGETAWRITLCAGCAEQHGFVQSLVIPGDDALDTLMAMEQSPVCHKCLGDLQTNEPCGK